MIRLCAFSDEAGSSLEEQIFALKRNNISLMELRSIDKKNVADFSIEEAMAYQKKLEENNISVWSIGSPIGKVNINVDFEEYLKKVAHVCELAKVFKTDKIRMFSFFHAYEDEEKVYEYLRKMVEVATSYGVNLYHENEKDIFGDTAERVQKIMNNVNGLKYIYDPANYLQCDQKAELTLELFHSKTDYFHIKDVISSTGQLVPAGYGDGMILDLLKMIKDDKTLTLEPHLTVFDAYKAIDNTEMKHKFTYTSANEAFDAAVSALKALLIQAGYKEENGVFINE
jgi:sugar phosphate isomerase/epimerase